LEDASAIVECKLSLEYHRFPSMQVVIYGYMGRVDWTRAATSEQQGEIAYNMDKFVVVGISE